MNLAKECLTTLIADLTDRNFFEGTDEEFKEEFEREWLDRIEWWLKLAKTAE